MADDSIQTQTENLMIKNVLLTDKDSLGTHPIGVNTYLIVEETRELYFDNDNDERFKLRDIQVLDYEDDKENATVFEDDFIYIKETNSLYYYDGTDFNMLHPDSGVIAGTYTKVTVDSKGHVTAGESPTTLSGYGLETAVDNAITNRIDSALSSTSTNAVQNKVLYEELQYIKKCLAELIDMNIDASGNLNIPSIAGGVVNGSLVLNENFFVIDGTDLELN